ncbi:MAG: hypothetical protein AAF941_07185 [Pseudomonadota bacterium]
MPIYSLMMIGENSPSRILADASGPHGLYASRVVEASDPEPAEELVVQMLRKELMHLVGERRRGDPNQ